MRRKVKTQRGDGHHRKRSVDTAQRTRSCDLRGPRCETEEGIKGNTTGSAKGSPPVDETPRKHINKRARRKACCLASLRTLLVGLVRHCKQCGGQRLRVSLVGDSTSSSLAPRVPQCHVTRLRIPDTYRFNPSPRHIRGHSESCAIHTINLLQLNLQLYYLSGPF